jgi:hypothetical protein
VLQSVLSMLQSGRSTKAHLEGHSIRPLHLNNHWVLLRSTGSLEKGRMIKMEVFDSAAQTNSWRSGSVDSACWDMFSEAQSFEVRQAAVQQQHDGTSCGYYVIAFMTELAHSSGEKDLSKIAFDPRKLSSHLLHCLKVGRMSRFEQLDRAAAARASISVEWCSEEDRYLMST